MSSEDDDDISAFGAPLVDTTVLCEVTELRDKEWILLKGELPFRIQDIKSFRWNMRVPVVVGCTLGSGAKIDVENDEEKTAVLGEAQEIVHRKHESKLRSRLPRMLRAHVAQTLRSRLATAVLHLKHHGVDAGGYTDRPVSQNFFVMGGCIGDND